MDLSFPISVTLLGMSMVFLTLGILAMVTSLVSQLVITIGEETEGEEQGEEKKSDIAVIAALDDWLTERGSEVQHKGKFKVSLDGHPLKVDLKERTHTNLEAIIEGTKYSLTKKRPSREKKPSTLTGEAKEEVIEAPLPGEVQQISVREGSQVEVDQVLLTLEAMKMENELNSPIDGIVKKILVAEGDEVEDRQELVILRRK